MNILLQLEHELSDVPLLIDVKLLGDNRIYFDSTLNLNKLNTELSIIFNIDEIVPQTLTLMLSTQDHNIVNYPLVISNIVLDEFYSMDHILHSGHPKFDNNFLTHAKRNNFHLDNNICDANRLDFTGTLFYYFKWPFYKNIWTNFRKLKR